MNFTEPDNSALLQLANELAGKLRIVIKEIGYVELIDAIEDLKENLVLSQLALEKDFVECKKCLHQNLMIHPDCVKTQKQMA